VSLYFDFALGAFGSAATGIDRVLLAAMGAAPDLFLTSLILHSHFID
jgi:hypothetical protein